MKKVKKLISLTLVLLFVVTLIPTTAGAGFFKEDKTTTVNEDGKWVSAWSTSPISASLNDLGVLDKLGVPVSLVTYYILYVVRIVIYCVMLIHLYAERFKLLDKSIYNR